MPHPQTRRNSLIFFVGSTLLVHFPAIDVGCLDGNSQMALM
jgi:hypothetical protein